MWVAPIAGSLGAVALTSDGWTLSLYEYELTIPTLWSETKKFIQENPQYVHKNSALSWISDNGGESYNLCHFWSNFEIGDLRFWRSEAYMAYFNHLEKAGGFYYERWGDAPVHSIAAALFLDKNEIHWFQDIGEWPSAECASGSRRRPRIRACAQLGRSEPELRRHRRRRGGGSWC